MIWVAVYHSDHKVAMCSLKSLISYCRLLFSSKPRIKVQTGLKMSSYRKHTSVFLTRLTFWALFWQQLFQTNCNWLLKHKPHCGISPHPAAWKDTAACSFIKWDSSKEEYYTKVTLWEHYSTTEWFPRRQRDIVKVSKLTTCPYRNIIAFLYSMWYLCGVEIITSLLCIFHKVYGYIDAQFLSTLEWKWMIMSEKRQKCPLESLWECLQTFYFVQPVAQNQTTFYLLSYIAKKSNQFSNLRS